MTLTGLKHILAPFFFFVCVTTSGLLVKLFFFFLKTSLHLTFLRRSKAKELITWDWIALPCSHCPIVQNPLLLWDILWLNTETQVFIKDCVSVENSEWVVGCCLFLKSELNFMGMKSCVLFTELGRTVVESVVFYMGKSTPRHTHSRGKMMNWEVFLKFLIILQ